MEKFLALAGVIIIGAIAFPNIAEMRLNQAQPEAKPQPVATQEAPVSPAEKPKKTFNPLDGRKARIAMDNRGHFITKVRMNGYPSEVLIDTGATYVAINETTARKLGIRLKDSDFKYKVNTANGITYAAAANIDEIQIGRISVQNVQASVSRDKSLSGTLLGMSFLKKLRKFEISGSELILVQ